MARTGNAHRQARPSRAAARTRRVVDAHPWWHLALLVIGAIVLLSGTRTLEDLPWWHAVLLVIGALTILTVASTLFLAIGESPARLVTDGELPPVDSPAFAAGLARLIGGTTERGGHVAILHNGDGFLPALLEAIDGAVRTINVSVYIWSDGRFSAEVLDALLRAQRRGVAVRILLDGFGAQRLPERRLLPLKEAGGLVETFRRPQLGRLTRLHRRNHRRAIVVDGRIGFTGGMAIADQWLGNAEGPGRWRDLMFRLTGPLARSLEAAFARAWAASSGEMLLGGGEPCAPGGPPPAGVECFLHHVHSPAEDDLSMACFLLVPLLAARERVYVTTPYFIPDRHLKEALISRAHAGVDVRLLLPGPHIDNPIIRLSAQNHYADLLAAGIRIFEYRPTFLHSKYIVVDGRWSIVGSPNLNSRSRRLDEENAFGILDRDLGIALEGVFLDDLARADEISPRRWRRRNPLIRLLQPLAQVLDQQS